MNCSQIILQGAMGAGLMFIDVGIGLLIAFSVGYTAMFINLWKNRTLKDSEIESNRNRFLVYFSSFILGVITAIITVTFIFWMLVFFFGDKSLD